MLRLKKKKSHFVSLSTVKEENSFLAAQRDINECKEHFPYCKIKFTVLTKDILYKLRVCLKKSKMGTQF